MTEYDYSPAAYERYIANQTRVSKWVDGQAAHASQYSSPFVPPSSSSSSSSRDSPLHDNERYSRHRDHDRERPSSSSRHSDSSSSRPQQVRRSSTNPPQIYKPSTHDHSSSHSRSRSNSHAHSSSHSHSHHSSRNREVVIPLSPTRSHAYEAYPYHHSSSTSQQTYKTYTIDPANTREIVLPPPKRGETYVIIPPAGQRIEVVVSLFHKQLCPSLPSILFYYLSCAFYPFVATAHPPSSFPISHSPFSVPFPSHNHAQASF